MKKLLLMASMVATTFAFAQSNEAGTIQLGLGWGATLGGATIENTYPQSTTSSTGVTTTKDTTTSDDGVGINSNYGIRAQYGVSELISVGIFVRMERGFYTVTNTTGFFNTTILASGFGFGIEPKIYPVNNDKFNLYVAPSIGFSTATTTITNFLAYNGSASGLNYGVTVGFNWYFSDVVGLSADLGYAGSALSGTMDDQTLFKDFTYKVNNGGFYTGLGLTLKFGN